MNCYEHTQNRLDIHEEEIPNVATKLVHDTVGLLSCDRLFSKSVMRLLMSVLLLFVSS